MPITPPPPPPGKRFEDLQQAQELGLELQRLVLSGLDDRMSRVTRFASLEEVLHHTDITEGNDAA